MRRRLSQILLAVFAALIFTLCDIDTTGPSVRFRGKQLLKTDNAIPQFTPGQLLPPTGPSVQPGHRYGDEALVFFSRSRGSNLLDNFVLIFHDGKTHDGATREAVLKLITTSK